MTTNAINKARRRMHSEEQFRLKIAESLEILRVEAAVLGQQFDPPKDGDQYLAECLQVVIDQLDPNHTRSYMQDWDEGID